MPGVAEHGVRTDHGVRMTRHEFPLPSLLSPADYATGCLDHPAFTLSHREGHEVGPQVGIPAPLTMSDRVMCSR